MSWRGRDEAAKAAKWLLRQSFKAQEQSDAQTVYLLNLLQEQRQELEARDAVMRESTVLVAKLQLEVESLRQQLVEKGLASSASVNLNDPCCKLGGRPAVATGTSEGGLFAGNIWRHRRVGKDTGAPRGAESVGGWEGSHPRPSAVHTCSTLEEAWSRLRRVPNTTQPTAKASTHADVDSSEACRETSFSPCTPQPSRHSPLDLRLASSTSTSSSPACPSSPPPSVTCATVASNLSRASCVASSSEVNTAADTVAPVASGPQGWKGADEPQPQPLTSQLQPPQPPQPLLNYQEERHQSQQQQPPPPQQQQQQQQQQRLHQQSDRQKLSQDDHERYEVKVQSLTALVASLQSQVEAARHEAREATSNYLTCRTDLEILTRKYDSLMLQKLEVEEQRDRLFSPHLDIKVIRAAMPSVDAAITAMEGRLEAAAEMLTTCHTEAEDAARVQNQQRRKWIARLEGLQAQLQEREARLADVEAQLGLGLRPIVQGACGSQSASAGAQGRPCQEAVSNGLGPGGSRRALVVGSLPCDWAEALQVKVPGQAQAQAQGLDPEASSSCGGSSASCGPASTGGTVAIGTRSSSGSMRSSAGGSWDAGCSVSGTVCNPSSCDPLGRSAAGEATELPDA